MDKDVYAYTHREWTPLRHLNNEIMPFAAAWMDLEINILMEVDRKRKTIFMWYHPYVESKKNISMKKKQTHKHTEQTCVCQGGMSGGLRWADEIYLYIEWIKNEVLQYGTGNSIQYLAINCNGKEDTCRAASVCCAAEMSYTSIMFLIFKNLWYIYTMEYTHLLKRIHLNQFCWDGWNWSRLYRVK